MSCSHFQNEYDPSPCSHCAAEAAGQEKRAADTAAKDTRIRELEEQNADLSRLNAHFEAEVANIAARQLQAEAQCDEWRAYATEHQTRLNATLTERDESRALVVEWIAIAESEKKSSAEFCRQIQSLTAKLDAALRANSDHMYATAWERELGPPYRAKSHHIDSMVLTTRDRMTDLHAYKQRVERVRELTKKPELLDVKTLQEALR